MDITSINFFEHYNATNISSPHFSPHDIFVKYLKSDGCSKIEYIPHEEKCMFIMRERSCKSKKRILDYLELMYCGVQKTESHTIKWLYIMGLACLAFYIFQLIGQLMSRFFIPSLNYTARTFRMSQSLAGATLLAMSNTIAGLYISWSDLMADIPVLYSATVGSATFQLTVVAGSICVIQPFNLYSPLFVRDTVFFVTLISYIQYILGDETVNPIESGILLFYYLLFITTVAIDTLWIKEMSRDIRRKMKLVNTGEADEKLKHELEQLQHEGVMEILIKDSKSVLDITTTESADFISTGANTKLFQQFFNSINPIEKPEWKRSNGCLRFLLVIRAPFLFLFFFLAPRVDFNRPNHGWSKLLNILNLWMAPMFFVTVSRMRKYTPYGVSLYVYVTIICIPLMFAAFFTSRTDKPPVYHLIFAFHALWFTIGLVRMCALEILSISYTISITSQLSPSFLAAIFTALESGIGALIANTTLAMRGYPRMGFAACYGAPLFSIPLSLGVRMLYKSLHTEGRVAIVHQGSLAGTLYVFAFSTACFSLVGCALAKHKARRSLGIFRIAIYPFFLAFTVLTEMEIVHSYSTYHMDQRVQMD